MRQCLSTYASHDMQILFNLPYLGNFDELYSYAPTVAVL